MENVTGISVNDTLFGAVKQTEEVVKAVVVKYILVGVLILIPVLLIPLLFLFTRSKKKAKKCDDPPLSACNLPVTVVLNPVSNDDPYICKENYGFGILKINYHTNQICYYLDKNKSLYTSKGQIYHPLSGLLFNPIGNERYDPNKTKKSNSGQLKEVDCEDSQTNRVYNIETNQLYERCFSLGFEPDKKEYFLPKEPPISKNIALIRWVSPADMPNDLADIYARMLLDRCNSSKKIEKPINNESIKHNVVTLDSMDQQTTPRSTLSVGPYLNKMKLRDPDEKSQYLDALPVVVNHSPIPV